MKIDYLQISNVLSFRYVDDISQAEKILFDSGLNIIIGENGSGKSTALEIINFLFKRVIYKRYNVNQELFLKRNDITSEERKQTLLPENQQTFSGFRLDPNWDTETNQQTIRLAIRLDEIDLKNVENIRNNIATIRRSYSIYSNHNITDDGNINDTYIIDVLLNKDNQKFSIQFNNQPQDFGFIYLSEYHFFKESIFIHNFLSPDNQLPTLYESFTLISSYRNYHDFQPSISLKESYPAQQMQKIRNNDYNRSLNVSDKSEPSIFALVRLQVAEKHFNLMPHNKSQQECEDEANSLPFINSINNRLKVVNLKCKIRLIELRTWQYSFEFFDTRREKVITDINCLSAGQKSIIHLVFEAYGRGDLKGGVVIIDEPEIHLHYQFQHEYLQVIEDLNKEQNCQYILVTHSEALINSSTINNVRRFSLTENGHTRVFSPNLSADEKSLIKILDNTRSTYAFFAKKVILVEGDSDRYFFRAVLLEKYKEFEQQIAILHIGGKTQAPKWGSLFTSFGLIVSVISDFDYITNLHYPNEVPTQLRDVQAIQAFKTRNQDWNSKIESEYQNRIYILKEGNLEIYLSIRKKDLNNVISFCRNSLVNFLADNNSSKSREIRFIFDQITN